MTEPSYKAGIPEGKKDWYEDLFSVDHLNANLSSPPDRPPMNECLVNAMFLGTSPTGEDFVGTRTSHTDDGDRDGFYFSGSADWSSVRWSASQFYRVRDAGTNVIKLGSKDWNGALYPRFPKASKLRNSNFDQPTNHVRTIFFISKQSETERGNGDPHALRGFRIPPVRVPSVEPNEYGWTVETKYMWPMHRVVNDPKENEWMSLVAKDFGGVKNPPPIFGPSYYADRFGFEKNEIDMAQFGNDGFACKNTRHFDRHDWKTGAEHPAEYGPTVGDATLYGSATQATVCERTQGLKLPQYTVPAQFGSVYSSTKLDEDHTYEDGSLHMSHPVCTSSPFFWLGTEHWRTILQRQAIDFMPYADPRKLTGEPERTRPITYRFWDGKYSTGMYGGPTFSCTYVDAANAGGSLPDIQAYRDALLSFSRDEGPLMEWHAKHYPNRDYPITDAIDPGNYEVMPGSGTRKDVEFRAPQMGELVDGKFPVTLQGNWSTSSTGDNSMDRSLVITSDSVKEGPDTYEFVSLYYQTDYRTDGEYLIAKPGVFGYMKSNQATMKLQDGRRLIFTSETVTTTYHKTSADLVPSTQSFKNQESMAKRRALWFRNMVHNNPNAVRDYRNTFCPRPDLVPYTDLSHHPQSDFANNKLPDAFTGNTTEYRRLVMGTDLMAAGLNFNSKLNHAALTSEHGAITQTLIVMAMNEVKARLEKSRAEGIEKLIGVVNKEVINRVAKPTLEAIIMKLQTKMKPKTVNGILKLMTKELEEGAVFDQERAVQELATTMVSNPKQILANFQNRIAAKVKSKVMNLKENDLIKGRDISSPEIRKGSKVGSVKTVVNDLTNDTQLNAALSDAQASRIQPDVPLYEDYIDDAGNVMEEYFEREVVDESVQFEVGVTEELVEAAAGATEAATSSVMTAISGVMAEAVPILIMTTILMGIEAFMASKQKEADYQAQLAKERAEAEEKKKQVSKYYNEMVPIAMGQANSDHLRRFLRDWKVDESEYGTTSNHNPYYHLPYRVVLEKLIKNEISIHSILPGWLDLNASNAKGKNILTAEMFREFRVIDHYLRDSDLSPSHGPRGPSDATWTGTLRPFPGVDGDPITLVPEVMTPLPVLSKGIRDKIGKFVELYDDVVLETPEFLGCFKDFGWENTYKGGLFGAAGQAIPGGVKYSSAAEAFAAAKASPDTYFVGLQGMKAGGTFTAFFGGKDADYAMYGKSTEVTGDGKSACTGPDGSGGISNGYNVGGEFINAVYRVRHPSHNAKLDWTLTYWYGPFIPKVITEEVPAEDVDTELGTIPLSSHTRKTIPVPVFVGFMKSPTGFVSSEDPSMAWPTVKYFTQGGPIAVQDLVRPNQYTSPFEDRQDFFRFVQKYESPKMLKTRDSGMGFVLNPISHSSDGWIVRVKNSTRRELKIVRLSEDATVNNEKDTETLWFNVIATLQPDATYDVLYTDLAVYGEFGTQNTLFCTLSTEVVSGKGLNSKIAQVQSKEWTVFDLYRMRAQIRTPYVKFGFGPWEEYGDAHAGKGWELDVHIMANQFVCPASTRLFKKIKDGRGLTTEVSSSYKTLHTFFDEVQDDLIVQSDDGCAFAEWLATKFGPAVQEQETYYKPKVTIYEPYTPDRQRALYFAYKHIWRHKKTVMTLGARQWNKILADFESTDVDEYLTTEEDQARWKAMYDEASTNFDGPVEIVTPPANTVDIGHLFASTEVTLDGFVGSTNDVESWVRKTLWEKSKFGVSVHEKAHFAAFMDLGHALSDLHDSGGSFGEATFTAVREIINNTRAGVVEEVTYTKSPMEEYEDDVTSAAEAVRKARIAMAKEVVAELESEVAVKAIDVDLGAQLGTLDDSLSTYSTVVAQLKPTNLLSTIRFMAKTALQMRELPNVRFKSYSDLQSLPKRTQLFARICKDAYKPFQSRDHLGDPEFNSVYFHQPNPISTDTTAVYYNPSGHAVLKSPCIVIAYRGTAFGSEMASLPKDMSKMQKFLAMATNKAGDFISDLKILTGSQISACRFKKSLEEAEKMMQKFDVQYVYFTGHSLGGALAMHALANIQDDRVVNGVVFNPGVGADRNYLTMVNHDIQNKTDYTQKKRQKVDKTQPWRLKLESHCNRGPTKKLQDDDPVSMVAGGLGTTYHYEGPGIPSSFACHTIRLFKENIEPIVTPFMTIPTI